MSIPVHLITGFLGSGKTSFLEHFYKRFNGDQKIAVVQNEFSSVNVDAQTLRQTAAYDLLEINNGSVFCVCLLGSFIDSLAGFIREKKPDVLIMEASGLSDPIGVGQMFQSEKLKGQVFLEHVWCLVDAMNFERVPALKTRMEHQLRTADTLIVNKVDLAADNVSEVVSEIKKVNPFARLLLAQYGEVDLNDFKKTPKFYPGSTQPLGRPDMASVVIRSSREISFHSLKKFLDMVQKDSIRCKGFIKLADKRSIFLQGVFNEVDIKEIPAFSGPTEFVLIGNFEDGTNLQVVFDEFTREK
ncbi:MAG: CobW family GTP-binding protein [Mangrovibacterium sp.]